MEILVRLYEDMKQYAPDGRTSFTMTYDAVATVGDVLRSLRIPLKTQKVVLVNGRRADENTPIEDESTLVLFPPIAGG